MKLSRYEQETIINFNANDQQATVYTCDPVWKRKLEKLAQEAPDSYRLVKSNDVGVTYTFSKKLISLRKPKILSEEERKIIAERLHFNSTRKTLHNCGEKNT